MQTIEIRLADEKEDFLKCWELVREQKLHLNVDRYLTLMLYMLDEGFKLIFIEEDEGVKALCGYRLQTTLDQGRSICINDLCYADGTGREAARHLLDSILAEAREEECQSVHLASAHNRFEEHKLFMEYGFHIRGHYLEKEL
jgi:N-acetylglutamate synthase-like GNAT family acetyltransferase